MSAGIDGCGRCFERLGISSANALPEKRSVRVVLSNRVPALWVGGGGAAGSDVDGTTVGRWAHSVEIVLFAQRNTRCWHVGALDPGRQHGAGRRVERCEPLYGRSCDCVEVAADPQDIVDIEFDVANPLACSPNPSGVECAGDGIELDEVGSCNSTIHRGEVPANPHRCSVGRDGLNLGVDIAVERGVERAGNCVELGDSGPGRAVDVREAPTDIQIRSVRRNSNGVDRPRAADNHGRKGRIHVAGSDIDCCKRCTRLAPNGRKFACDVESPVRFNRFGDGRALHSGERIGVRRWLGRIDICRTEHRRGRIVGFRY